VDNKETKLTASVIMINYNGGSILPVIRQSIEAICHQSMSDWELILVDDGSTDGSNEFLASFDDGERVRFVQRDHRGVGAARNAGLRVARGRYLAFVDNDAIPALDWLEHIVAFLDSHPKHGAAASLVFFADRPGVINSAGCVLNELAHGIGIGMFELYPFYSSPEQVLYATGNGMVIRREALERVGEFDEGFLFYGHDDSDIGIRIRNAGYSIAPVPTATLQHLHSTSKRDPMMIFWDQRNRLRFALKHYSTRELLWFILVDAKAHLDRSLSREYIKAWGSVLKGWRQVWDYRTQRRSQGSYFHRFASFFTPESRYIKLYDNRMYAQSWYDINEGLTVDANEEQYLYQGWYWKEYYEGKPIRWAMPTASLRFIAAGPIDRFSLSLVLPPTIEQLDVKVHLYSWSEEWHRNQASASAGLSIQGQGIKSITFSPSSWPDTDQFLMVFEASRYFQEPGYFPRRLAWGLHKLEVHPCVSC
jgi:GT2 family glycosyltransferase